MMQLREGSSNTQARKRKLGAERALQRNIRNQFFETKGLEQEL